MPQPAWNRCTTYRLQQQTYRLQSKHWVDRFDQHENILWLLSTNFNIKNIIFQYNVKLPAQSRNKFYENIRKINTFTFRKQVCTLLVPPYVSVTLRVCPPGQWSAIAVNYTACPTRLRALDPLVINERSNLLPAKARANSLSLVKLGSKASSDWGAHQCGLDEVSPAVSYVGIFLEERAERKRRECERRSRGGGGGKFTRVSYLKYARTASSIWPF